MTPEIENLDDLLMNAKEKVDAAERSADHGDKDAAWASLRIAEVSFREYIRCALHTSLGTEALNEPDRLKRLAEVAERLRIAGMKLEYDTETLDLLGVH